jgi:hypothetical protein
LHLLPAESGGDADLEKTGEKGDGLILEREYAEEQCARARHRQAKDDVPSQPAIEDIEEDAQAAEVNSQRLRVSSLQLRDHFRDLVERVHRSI